MIEFITKDLPPIIAQLLGLSPPELDRNRHIIWDEQKNLPHTSLVR